MTDTPTTGPRRRKRPQADTPDAASASPQSSGTDHTAPDTQNTDSSASSAPAASRRGPTKHQLRLLFLLRLQGLTQKEIGLRLGRKERTIRNWEKQINPAELGLEQAYSPLAALNRDFAQLEVDGHKYRTWQRQAEAEGDYKQAAQMLGQARSVDRERQQLLQRLNVYDAARALMPHAKDGASADFADWLALFNAADDDLPPEEPSNDNAE